MFYPSGEGLYTIHHRKRHQEIQVHLQKLLEMNEAAFVFVVMDNASAHTTDQLNAFWEENADRIEQVLLPTYSPHLNLIERVWGYMRNKMTRNQFYDGLLLQTESIVDWLTNLPFSRFCSLIGIDEASLSFV